MKSKFKNLNLTCLKRISKSGKGELIHKSREPGPGSYAVTGGPLKGGITMSGKSNQSSLLGKGIKTPGPGQYSVNNCNRPKTAGGTFGVKTGSSLTQN